MEEKERQRRTKIIQYVMTAVLLALAFLLPACAVRRQETKQESLSDNEAGEQTGSAKGETDGAGDTGQTGTGGTGTEDSENTNLAGPGGAGAGGAENKNLAGTGAAGTDSGSTETNESQAKSGTIGGGQTIVIDPGHGGDDPGMIGGSGISEKVLNLVYAKKLAALLEAEGFRVVLTRSTEDGLYDEGVSNKKAQDMQRRCAVIAEEQPVLTVSIHQNSYAEDTSVRGPQVFYYEQSAEGAKLAAAIQDSLNTVLAIERPRQQKGNASYYILKRSESVTVIVECGFLTNPEEEALLQEEDYQDQVVLAICAGVLDYLQGAE